MKKRAGKKGNKKLRGLCIALGVCLFLAAADGGFLIANVLAERTARTLPSYARQPIEETLKKPALSASDYEFLYRQTGLSQAGILRLKEKSASEAAFEKSMLEFQDALFLECEIGHEFVSPVTLRDYAVTTSENGSSAEFYAPLVPLENGDVLVTSVCHTLGWRHGHSALVVEAGNETVLESVAPGRNSTVTFGGAFWFRESPNFMVLRLKNEYRSLADPEQVAAAAKNTLYDLPYSFTVGFFSKKDQGEKPKHTHCSHLVWQAYKSFGVDIDGNGGALVTSRDIARSDRLEVVQVYGFDPVKLW